MSQSISQRISCDMSINVTEVINKEVNIEIGAGTNTPHWYRNTGDADLPSG